MCLEGLLIVWTGLKKMITRLRANAVSNGVLGGFADSVILLLSLELCFYIDRALCNIEM